mgnify:CR=1 FL=1
MSKKRKKKRARINLKDIIKLLIAAWVIFIASDKGVLPSIFLMCAGAYALAEIIPAIWRGWKRCQ